MSAGLSELSDADLMRMLGEAGPAPAPSSPRAAPAAPGGSSLAHLSDDDLMRQLAAAPPAQTAASTAKDIGRSFEGGVDVGVAGLIGLPNAAIGLADRWLATPAARMIGKATGLTPKDAPLVGTSSPLADRFPSSEAVAHSLETTTGPAYKPQTTAGEVAHTVGEFAPNALAGGGGAILGPSGLLKTGETVAQTATRVAARRSDILSKGAAAQVVAPALASEGAGRIAREVAPEYEGSARLVGGLAGGVGTAIAQAPRGVGMVREALEGFSPETLAQAQAFRAQARELPGGGIDIPLDEALNHVTGGQASRVSQIARVVANSGGEGQRIAGDVYAARPGQVDAAGRAAFDAVAEKSTTPTALGGSVQDAARAGLMDTPQGMALTEARAAAGPRVTPEQAGQVIQPELRGVYDRREGMRAALADQEYTAAREAPEGIGIERTVAVERPGEPIVTQPQLSRPDFTDAAPRPLDTAPGRGPTAVAEGAGPESMARFIARNGGLELTGDLRSQDYHRFNIPGVGNVAREGGKPLDSFWREHLIEHGYLKPDADGGMARDIRGELMRKLENEKRGFPSYPIGAERAAASERARPSQVSEDHAAALSMAESRLNQDLGRVGVDPASVHPDIRSRTLGSLMRGEHADPLEAYERTVGGMKGPLQPYSKSTTVTEEIPDVRFGQANPQDVLDHVNEAMRTAKGPALVALQQARKTLYELDGKTLDLSVAGLHGSREAISDLIEKAPPAAQRSLMGVRDRLDRALAAVPEYEHARSGFESASRNLDPFDTSAVPGRIIAQDQASGRFTMPAERTPVAIDDGPTAARTFNQVASPEARTAYEGHLTTRLLDGATDAETGAISSKKLRTAMRANEDVLAQFPAVRERLSNVAIAHDGMAAVERSPLGLVAKKPDVKRAVGVLFDRDPLAGGEKEIGAAMGALAKADPTAARQLARIHLETVFDDAVRDTRGLPAQYGGAGFASAVGGNPQQAKNLEAAIRALPEGDTLWTGLDRFLGTLKATGYRPQKGSDTTFNTAIREELKGGGSVKSAITDVVGGAAAGGSAAGPGGAAAGGFLGVKKAASEAFTRYRIGRNGEAVARMLFDPKALPDLRGLAKSKPGSKNVDYFSGRLLALAAGGSAPGERTAR